MEVRPLTEKRIDYRSVGRFRAPQTFQIVCCGSTVTFGVLFHLQPRSVFRTRALRLLHPPVGALLVVVLVVLPVQPRRHR